MPADRQPAPEPRRGFSDPLLDAADPVRVLRFLLRPATRWALCWILALGSTVFVSVQAWYAFAEPPRADGKGGRADGNWGHATIDFGGQYVLGRMIVEGQGRHLYNRTYIRPVVEASFPPGGERPDSEHSDAENLLTWLAGHDDREMVASFLAPLGARDALGEAAVLATGCDSWTPERLQDVTGPHLGGSLYPPIHALLFAPVSAMPPRVAYRFWQALILLMVFLDGWVVHRLTEGRVWWPVAVVFLFLFPGFVGCVNLGQNGVLSLTLILLGWWQLARGRPVLAGVLWGLLAFKPVWAAAFFLVPVMTRQWRMAAAMAATGLAQIVLTLPVVGWENWLYWLKLGRQAGEDYAEQENWIFLSRDLLGIPRRWLLTYKDKIAWDKSEQPLPTALGWGLLGLVLGITLLVAWVRRRRAQALTGPPTAFIQIGALFTCYHFMYYDFVVAALPVVLVFTRPREYLRLTFLRLPRWLAARTNGRADEPLSPEMRSYYQPTLDELTPPPMPLLPGGRRPRWVRASLPPLLLFLMLLMPAVGAYWDETNHFPPSETFALLALWAWCGWRTLTDAEDTSAASTAGLALDGADRAGQLAELGTNVGGAHERLADQHGADAGRP